MQPKLPGYSAENRPQMYVTQRSFFNKSVIVSELFQMKSIYLLYVKLVYN